MWAAAQRLWHRWQMGAREELWRVQWASCSGKLWHRALPPWAAVRLGRAGAALNPRRCFPQMPGSWPAGRGGNSQGCGVGRLAAMSGGHARCAGAGRGQPRCAMLCNTQPTMLIRSQSEVQASSTARRRLFASVHLRGRPQEDVPNPFAAQPQAGKHAGKQVGSRLRQQLDSRHPEGAAAPHVCGP